LKPAAVLLLSAILASTHGARLVAAQAPTEAPAPAKPLTVEAIYAHGSLTGTLPDGLAWSPDGKHLTYLDDGELLDLGPDLEPELKASQHPGLAAPRVLVSRAKLAVLAEASDSETDRDRRDRYKIASYLWAPDSAHLLFDSNGRLWFYDLHNGTGVQIGYSGAASSDDPKFSPNGDFISFVRDHGLSVVRLKDSGMPSTMPNTETLNGQEDGVYAGGMNTPRNYPFARDRDFSAMLLRDKGAPPVAIAPTPKSSEPHALITNGEVDWVYEEELDTRSNYFWSPDSKRLAYLEMNEKAVPQVPIVDWIPTHAVIDFQSYPQPGDPNPEVRVGVVSAGGGKTEWVKLPLQPGLDYIPRFGWVDAKTLWIETVTRDQKHRDLYFANAANGQAYAVLQLSDDKFLDDNYDLFVGSGSIVLTNWSDGHNHLYLYSYNQADPAAAPATLERQLTKGDFEVGEVYRVDTAGKLVYYASNEGNPLDRQIWRVSFAGERKQLSEGSGHHEGSFAPTGGAFADKQSTRFDPPALRLCLTAGNCTVFWQTHVLEPYHLRAPVQLEVKAHDGATLYATLLLPEGAATPASLPLIVNPYGGPGEQSAANLWKDGLLFDELLAQHGFAVLRADNRGMGNRGRAFAQAAYHNFGAVQLEDQLTVLDAVLARYPQLDSRRLGWWGWSWGGTFTLYALTHSDRFRAGVAVASVTDWRNYDSIYTERYLGLPTEFASGYKNFSVVNAAANLKGRLLLIHGTGDDNVHIGNTVQFVRQLIEAGIPYDLQLYPRKTHSIAGAEVRTHLYSRILAHFEEYLKPQFAPEGAKQ
jgi:dipeptidyl-peptidase-4